MTERNEDRVYHEARAQAELRQADSAADPAVAAIHRELAALHKRRLIEAVKPGPAERI